MKNLIPLGVLLAATLTTSLAQTTVYLEDFEDDTIGGAPAISGSNIGDGYSSVINTASVESNPDATGNTSSKVFRGGGGTPDANGIEAYFDSGPHPVDGMTIAFDFYNERGPTGNANDPDSVRIALQGAGGRDVFMRNDRDALIKLDGNDQAESNYGEGVWQRFTAVFTLTSSDASSGTYDLDWTLQNLDTSASKGGTQSVVIATSSLPSLEAEGLYLEIFDSGDDATNFFGYVDNLEVTLGAAPPALPQAHLAIDVTNVDATNTSQAVVLTWAGTDLPGGATYEIVADQAVSFPGGNDTGSAAAGTGTVNATVDGSLGNTTFTLTFYDGATPVASDTATIYQNRPNVILIMTDDMGVSDFGCYGSEINTPVIDSLASNGIKYRNFYNTARCSTTRCALLSGLYTHQCATNPGASLPPLDDDNNVTIAELLSTTGYRRYMAGKWHIGTSNDLSPIGRGFQHIFGQTSGGNFPHNQVSGGNHGSFWNTGNFGYYSEGNEIPEINYAAEYPGTQFHQTTFIGEYSLRFLDHHLTKGDGAPFFLYMPFNAVHWDINAPNDMADRYTDIADASPDGLTSTFGGTDGGDFYQYEVGWNQTRADRFARQLALGFRDPSWVLSPKKYAINSNGWNGHTQGPNPPLDPIPDWGSVDPGTATVADRQNDLARRMALYAAMLEMVDQNIGKVVDKLTAEGLLDNTIIFICADNGGNYEGGLYGKTNGTINANPVVGTANLQGMGQPANPDLHVGGGWANVNNTPFRLFKHFSHEGGIRSPGIIHYPDGIPVGSRGRWIDDRAHLIDVMATIADVTNTTYPATFTDPDNSNVRNLTPLAGKSLKPHFDVATEASFPSSRPLGFEHERNRAWIKNDYKFVTKNFNFLDGTSPADELELYDLTVDPTELNNLATTNVTLLSEYIDEWNTWAMSVGVPSDRWLAGITPTASITANPDEIPGNVTANSVDLTWTAAFVPTGSTYEITASPNVIFPGGDSTGPTTAGSGTVEATVNGFNGDTTFYLRILDGPTTVVSDTTTVTTLAPEVDPASLPNDLFVDTFNRADNANHDVVLTGMSGSVVTGLSPDGAYYDSWEAGLTEIATNKLDMAVGSGGMTETSIQHNFIDSEILASGGFSVQVRVEEIDSAASDLDNRFGGIAVGLSSTEAQSSNDVGSTSTPLSYRGRTNNPNGSADFFIDLALDGNLRCWSNGVILDTIPVGQTSGNLLVCYELSSFNAGASVTVTAFLDDVLLDLDTSGPGITQSFMWDATNSNYIGLSARASNFVTLENFAIRTLPLAGSMASNYANAAGLSGMDAAPDQDPDHDGDDNFMEWIKAGDPTQSDSGTKLLTLVPSPGGEFRLNYVHLNDADKAGLTYSFHYSTDLSGNPATWPTFTPDPISSTSMGTAHTAELVRVPNGLVSANQRLYILIRVH